MKKLIKVLVSFTLACCVIVISSTPSGATNLTDTTRETQKNEATYPLFVDTSSYFWMRKESGLNVAQTYENPDLFNIAAQKGEDSLSLTDGVGFERLSKNNTLWAGVVEYDDGFCKPCIVTAVDTENNTVSVYPKVEKNITNGRFTALLSDSQHLTELGYKAFCQYIYSVNPKHCDKSVAIDRYAPTSTEEMNTPYTRLPGTPAIYNGKRNDYSAWSMSQSVYGTFLIPYADYLTEGEYGFEREVEVSTSGGFYETYIGTVYYPGVTDVTKFEKDKGHELHIEWYVDGELISSQLKTTNYVERFCFDIPYGYETAKIKVYYTQLRKGCDDTISIGDSTVWVETDDYGEKLFADESDVVQMFDSWGAFWAHGEVVKENGATYPQGISGKEFSRLLNADGSTLTNRSIGGMTSRYGKAWFEKTVAEKQPDYVLLDYGINDYHSSTGSVFFNEVAPDGSVIDMGTAFTEDEFAENMYEIFSESLTYGITPIYVCGFIAEGPSWNTTFINKYVEMCRLPAPFVAKGKNGFTVDVENKLLFSTVSCVTDLRKHLILPVNSELGSEKTSMFWGTGDEVCLRPNLSSTKYKLIVEGDIDGDGVCDVLDAAAAQLYSAGFHEPTRLETYAANGCISEEIDVLSYQNVVNKVLAS